MSTTATITSKGQITIPKAVRTSLGLKKGDTVRFDSFKEGGFVFKRAAVPRSAFGVLHPYLPKNFKPPSAMDIKKVLKDRLAQRHIAIASQG